MPIPTIERPEKGEFKGNPTLSIPTGDKGYAFTFGLAKAIIEHIDAIEEFVEDCERKGVKGNGD